MAFSKSRIIYAIRDAALLNICECFAWFYHLDIIETVILFNLNAAIMWFFYSYTPSFK